MDMTTIEPAATSSGGRKPLFGRAPLSTTRDGWDRKMSVTLGYLKDAQTRLDEAEAHIAALQKRIATLEALTTTDDLTGISNRRGFHQAFLSELERCRRSASKGGLLVMIDLDNFKPVNDRFGHPAGDAVLKLVGRTLVDEIRRTDIAARIGGDEFVLLLTNTTSDEATARAQTIAWQLNNLSLAWDGHIIPVQASVGLKPFGANDRPEAIISDADDTLYATKTRKKENHATIPA